MKTVFTGVGLNVMTQALHAEEGSLPQGLMIQNAYTDMQQQQKCCHCGKEWHDLLQDLPN